MFQRLTNGWELAKQSFNVLRLDKELLLFPLMSGLACIIVLASFAAPLWNSDYLNVVFEERQAPEDPLAYVILFAFYFINYFVIVFFNSALVACAIIRFRGGNPTLGDGLRAATERLPQILGWAAVSATVGVVLRIIESRSERAGQIAAGLLGMAWSITTFFVVPVLVIEKGGPVTAVKRSLSILRKTWGEALSANFGIGVITFLATLPGIIAVVAGVAVAASGYVALGAAAIAAGILLVLIVALVSSALNAILLAALYLYAATDELPQHFDSERLAHAFAGK